MNKLFAFCLIVLITGCSKPDISPKQSIHLVDRYDDTLGIVSYRAPQEFDTVYRWIHTSDCMCCGAVKYRSHSRKHMVVTEDGFLPDTHLDSGFYFTISHFNSIVCDSQLIARKPIVQTSQSRINRFFNLFKRDQNVQQTTKSDDIIIENSLINGNNFYIKYTADTNYYKSIEKNLPAYAVIFNTMYSSTYYKDRRISISFKSNVHERDSFYLLAMDLLETIEIK